LTTRIENRIIALAGLFQAANQVAVLAKDGTCDKFSTQPLIDSLFVFDADETLDIYGNELANLHTGLTLLSDLSNKKSEKIYTESTRYALNILIIEKQLHKNPEMLKVIHSRLTHMDFNQTHFSSGNSNLESKLSGLYQDTFSTLKFRIHVSGNMDHLTQTQISDKIRSLLFAGVRSAMLWRQLGGTKWQIIFKRSEIEKVSSQLLKQISTTQH